LNLSHHSQQKIADCMSKQSFEKANQGLSYKFGKHEFNKLPILLKKINTILEIALRVDTKVSTIL